MKQKLDPMKQIQATKIRSIFNWTNPTDFSTSPGSGSISTAHKDLKLILKYEWRIPTIGVG